MSEADVVWSWKDRDHDGEDPAHPAGQLDLGLIVGGLRIMTSEDLGTNGCCSANTWCGQSTC